MSLDTQALGGGQTRAS